MTDSINGCEDLDWDNLDTEDVNKIMLSVPDEVYKYALDYYAANLALDKKHNDLYYACKKHNVSTDKALKSVIAADELLKRVKCKTHTFCMCEVCLEKLFENTVKYLEESGENVKELMDKCVLNVCTYKDLDAYCGLLDHDEALNEVDEDLEDEV